MDEELLGNGVFVYFLIKIDILLTTTLFNMHRPTATIDPFLSSL